MWSLKQKQDGTFYLTYDKFRRFTFNTKGLWEWIGPQNSSHMPHIIRVNESSGHLCCNDDEGNVRALVLEE
jgi:hypothetical protein